MGCRKNLKTLSTNEKQRFIDAVLTLKAGGGYDKYVNIHANAALAHGNPLFLPWHREFILRFEHDLQAIDSSVSLPYWDWTVDNLDSTGTVSLIWNDTFMGGPGGGSPTGPVTTGPFAGWGLTRKPFNIFASPGTGGLILGALADPLYDDFRPDLESPHGSAHVWVGGWMGNVPTAPRDPTFFLLHSNVDRLWAEWIHQHQSDPGFVAFGPASSLNSSMWPWNGTAPVTPPWDSAPEIRRPVDVLDHRGLGYFYDTVDPECRPIIKLRIKEIAGKEIFKERVKEVKETIKAEIKDPKELRKEGIKEIKEPFKETVKEVKETIKEIKEGGKELVKESPDKTIKEKDKDKDLVENLGPITEIDPELLAGSAHEHVTAAGEPFITAEERPAVDATGMMVHPEPKVAGQAGMPMEPKKPEKRMRKTKPSG